MERCSKKTRANVVMDLFSITKAARGKQWMYKVPVVGIAELYIPGGNPSEPTWFTPEQTQAILGAFE